MKVWLLTHTEELKKSTGTGHLVKKVLQESCEIIEWSRVSPAKSILDLSPIDTLLVYPQPEKQNPLANIKKPNNIIIIDGTWQQARKIYNRSPYLKVFHHYEIQGEKSLYTKRRNQSVAGLCTIEAATYMLTQYQHPAVNELHESFLNFNQ